MKNIVIVLMLVPNISFGEECTEEKAKRVTIAIRLFNVYSQVGRENEAPRSAEDICDKVGAEEWDYYEDERARIGKESQKESCSQVNDILKSAREYKCSKWFSTFFEKAMAEDVVNQDFIYSCHRLMPLLESHWLEIRKKKQECDPFIFEGLKKKGPVMGPSGFTYKV